MSEPSCAGVRARLMDVVLGAPVEAFSTESLDYATRTHLAACGECRTFLESLISMQEMAAAGRARAESEASERVASGWAVTAIGSAIDEGLARRDEAAGRRGASLLETLAFAAFAALVLAVQAMLFLRLRPAVVLVIEAGLNWLAPFTFYIIYRLNRRGARRKEEAQQ